MSCVNNNHKYGLWEINESENLACRTCKNCGYKEEFLKEDIHDKEIKKQKEADLFFKAFDKVDINDLNIIGYLNVILDDYVNYLDNDAKNLLLTKMEMLENSNIIDVNNSMYLKKLSSSLKSNDIDVFLDELELFQEYNAVYFNTILDNKESNARHL